MLSSLKDEMVVFVSFCFDLVCDFAMKTDKQSHDDNIISLARAIYTH